MLTAKEIQGMYAIIPTPSESNANKYDAVNTVDLSETQRLVNQLINDGSTGLIVLGTTGECATLSEPDYKSFTSCVLETVAKRVPTFVGATAMGGHEVVRRLKMVRDMGATGTLLGLPMWQPVTTTMAVDFYQEISKLFPDLALMVYANARAFRYHFPKEFWQALSKVAPTATSAKYSRVEGLSDLIAATEGKINFVPNDMVVHEFHAVSPSTTTACWATAAGMNPLPSILLMKALESGDKVAIEEVSAAIAWTNQPIMPLVEKPEIFAQYNIQLEKTRINSAGYSTCGPVRPPYNEFPEDYKNAAVECGRRWAKLCASYESGFSFSSKPWKASV